jgi:hypothetical protein
MERVVCWGFDEDRVFLEHSHTQVWRIILLLFVQSQDLWCAAEQIRHELSGQAMCIRCMCCTQHVTYHELTRVRSSTYTDRAIKTLQQDSEICLHHVYEMHDASSLDSSTLWTFYLPKLLFLEIAHNQRARHMPRELGYPFLRLELSKNLFSFKIL